MSRWSIISRRIPRLRGLRTWRANVSFQRSTCVPNLPLELWLKIIRYITDDESEDPIGDMLHLWLGVRMVSHLLRAAVELAFQDVYLKQVFIGQAWKAAPCDPAQIAQIEQIAWFPFERLVGDSSERAIFASNDYWGGYFGSATPDPQHQGKLHVLTVWLPPDRMTEIIEIADLDVSHTRREVTVQWRDVLESFTRKVAQRRAYEAKHPLGPPIYVGGKTLSGGRYILYGRRRGQRRLYRSYR